MKKKLKKMMMMMKKKKKKEKKKKNVLTLPTTCSEMHYKVCNINYCLQLRTNFMLSALCQCGY
jgi:hypothetical protein